MNKYISFLLLLNFKLIVSLNPIKFCRKKAIHIKSRLSNINFKKFGNHNKMVKNLHKDINELHNDINDLHSDINDLNYNISHLHANNNLNKKSISFVENNKLFDITSITTTICIIIVYVMILILKMYSIILQSIPNMDNLIHKNIYNRSLYNSTTFPDIKNLKFEIRGFSLSKFILGLGILITSVSFYDYFGNDGGGTGVSSLGFIYGIPIILIGAALQYGEILPVKIIDNGYSDLFKLKGTDTMKQIISDTTRHRYGDIVHLDKALKYLNLVLPAKKYPEIKYIEYNKESDDKISMTCVFQSLEVPYTLWNESNQMNKYNTFFGPNVTCSVLKIDKDEKLVGIKIKSLY